VPVREIRRDDAAHRQASHVDRTANPQTVQKLAELPLVRRQVIRERRPVGEAPTEVVVAQHPEPVRRERVTRRVPGVEGDRHPGEKQHGPSAIRARQVVVRQAIAEPNEMSRRRPPRRLVERLSFAVQRDVGDQED
jgi:hypothetical protein